MRRPTGLIACAAVGVLLFVCSPAGAIPPFSGLTMDRRPGDPHAGARQLLPLPALVPPPNDAFAARPS